MKRPLPAIGRIYSGINMTRLQMPSLLVVALLLLLGGCATRPVNPPITQADPRTGYRFETRQAEFKNKDNLVILAFSGGGTRAAAFSYGVLEFLRRTEIVAPNGTKIRLLDSVDVITGVSGGSFTALAYGLYGEKLFDDYEQRFLKRNVQGELISRALSPRYWGDLSSEGWGRSELAAQLYDEILFNGATFGDLNRGKGPMILASATDISTGSRFVFNQGTFDIICSDLNAVPLSRAAAASSAVPVVLSSITIKNYGGTCNWTTPGWARLFLDTDNPPRPAARAIRSLRAVQAYGDGARRPYLHLVDGGVSDNVGMRGVLDALEIFEALHEAGLPTPLDSARRIIVFVVNSLSSPPTNWDESYSPPGTVDILLKSAGTPIDAFSYETIELLRDTAARWQTLRMIRNSAAFAANKDPKVAVALRVPTAEIYAIDVSFSALKDKKELDYLNLQPTTFVLSSEAVDRLRAAGGTIILDSPEFQRLLKDVGAKLVAEPAAGGPSTAH
jgi:NTE family protein